MNSSGIKRGLAATAVAALAVTGLPFLASSASAADATALEVASVGPVRDLSKADGAVGGLVVLKVKGVTVADAPFTKLRLVDATDGTKAPSDGSSQDVRIARALTAADFAAEGTAGDTHPGDGFAEITVPVAVDTTTAGDAFKFRAYWDTAEGTTAHNDATGVEDLGINEPRTAVISGTTVGAPTSVAISPASQTAPKNVASGDYTVVVRDAQNRVTQLATGESIDLSSTTIGASGGVATPDSNGDASISADEIASGSATFTATGDEVDSYTLKATGNTGPLDTKTATARLDVVGAAQIDNTELNVVTGADSWSDFGKGTLGAGAGNGVAVRVDQGSIELKFDSDTPADYNGTIVVTATAPTAGATSGIKFGGKTTKDFTTVLDSEGKGSITITPDAGTIAEGRTFSVDGAGLTDALNVRFERAKPSRVVANAKTYVSKIGGSVDVTLTATDQFGFPATGAYVGARRINGVNGGVSGETVTKKAVNADGQATFTFTDTKATTISNAKDDILASVYVDQFDPVGVDLDPATGGVQAEIDVADIIYTADGQGGDFQLKLDGLAASGAGYDPKSVTINPLTDGIANTAADERVAVGIVDATTGAPVTVTADNGALVLKSPASDAQRTLANGKESQSGVVGTDSFEIIGTKAGLTTVTVTSGGREKKAQFYVVQSATPAGTARNLAVTAPEKANSGDIATFTVKVTDAFGNPIPSFGVLGLNLQVSGPARLQDTDATTDANGELKVNVRLDDDADSAVTLRAAATGAQFGAAANHKEANDGATPTAPGLTASQNVVSGSVTKVTDLQGLQEAVDQAQAKVDAAQDKVDAAKGDLTVAKAERSVAQKAVKAAKKDLRQAKKHHKGVKAARKALREARGDKRVASAKVSVAQAKVNSANADLADAQAELAAAQQALEDAQK